MWPIIISSRWERSKAKGFAHAFGKAYLVWAKEQMHVKTQHSPELLKDMFTLHQEVLDGMKHDCGQPTFSVPNVFHASELEEQIARAQSARALVLESVHAKGHGHFIVIDGKKYKTYFTLFIEGKITHSWSVDVSEEVLSLRPHLHNADCLVFIGDFVEEVQKCWPDAVSTIEKPLVMWHTEQFIHHSVQTYSTHGLFHHKKTRQVRTQWRMVFGGTSKTAVAIVQGALSPKNKPKKINWRQLYSKPFLRLGSRSAILVNGPTAENITFDYKSEQDQDWAPLAENIVKLLADHVF